MDTTFLESLGWLLLGVMGVALVSSVLLLSLTYYQVRNLNLPPNLGFVETLHRVPFLLVLGLDLLDLGLDFFSAPIVWLLLSRLNLQGLRLISTFESLLPGTQAIPTLSIAWIVVRVFKIHSDDIFQRAAPLSGRFVEGQAREVRPPRQ